MISGRRRRKVANYAKSPLLAICVLMQMQSSAQNEHRGREREVEQCGNAIKRAEKGRLDCFLFFQEMSVH
jgi:hypothetical protein